MRRITFFLLLSVNLLQLKAQDKGIFLYKNENGYSYMNAFGKPIIKKHFPCASRFFEGLAVAQQNGYVGYINKKGIFIIPPNYEYALPFHDGIAKVWLDGKQYLIDRKGQLLFEHNYRFIDYAINNSKKPVFRVTTKTWKQGVIDKTGKILIDTTYQYISEFIDGYAVIHFNNEANIINFQGKNIVPFGTYSNIGLFHNGRAFVKSTNWHYKSFGFIDTCGNLVYKKDQCETQHSLMGNFYQDSNFVLKIPIDSTHEKYAWAVLDLNGNIVYKDEEATYITSFQNGYAFIEDQNGDYLIDKKGKVHHKDSNIVAAFINDDQTYWVHSDGQITDLVGKKIMARNLFIDNHEKMFIHKGIVFHGELKGDFIKWELIVNNHNKENNEDEEDEEDEKKIQFSSIDYKNGFKEGLMQIALRGESFNSQNEWGYINEKGELTYTSPILNNIDSACLNINYSIDRSLYETCEIDSIGFLEKFARKIPEKFSHLNSPTIILDTNLSIHSFRFNTPNFIYTHKFFVINPTNDTLSLYDTERWISIQAKDRNGKWRDIEYTLPTDIISDAIIDLHPNKYWIENVISYNGGFKTKVRVIVHFAATPKNPHGKSHDLISNEIDCNINASQFIRKSVTKFDDDDNMPFEDYGFDRIYSIP